MGIKNRKDNSTSLIDVNYKMPNLSEGINGDLSFYLTNKGINLYGKIDNNWYQIGNTSLVGPSGKPDKKKSSNIVGKETLINRDTDKFCMFDSGVIKYVTGANLASYINSSLPITALNNATANELVTVGGTTTELEAEANLTFDGDHLSIASTGKLYFGADSHTYIHESGDDILKVFVGGTEMLSLTESTVNGIHVSNSHLIVDAINRIILDGSAVGNTYISETSADVLGLTVGGSLMMKLTEDTTNKVEIQLSDLEINSGKKFLLDGNTGEHTYIAESADDVLDIYAGGDKMLTLDEANDTITMAASNWVAGTVSGATITEFSAANSAYAGMVLGYTRLQGDLTNSQTYEIQDDLTVEDSTHQITFKTPPSELVEIQATFMINAVSSDTRIVVGLSDSDTYNAVSAEFEYDGTGVWFTDDEVDDNVCTVQWVLSASHLAAIGSSNTFYIGFSTSGSSKTAYIGYGIRAATGRGEHPFVIKATALPAAIYDGS